MCGHPLEKSPKIYEIIIITHNPEPVRKNLLIVYFIALIEKLFTEFR